MTTDPVVAAYAEASKRVTAEGEPFALRTTQALGRTVRVYAQMARNLQAFFAETEARFPDRVLVAEDERRWTYGEIFVQSRRLAAVLQDRFAVKAGDRVGIAMRNRAEWVIAFLAITRIGAVAVLFNSRSAGPELAAAAGNVTCSAHIVDEERAALLRAGGANTPLVLASEAVIAEGAREADEADCDPDAPAAILFTSGTTGQAKGAVLTHRNLSAMVSGIQFNSALAAAAASKPPSAAPPYSALLVFPLFHVSGLLALFGAMVFGGMLTTMRRWSPEGALALIEANKITSVTGPPLVMHDLLDQPGAAERLSGVTRFLSGGQATSLNLVQRAAEALPNAGQGVGWGSTETGGSVSGCTGALFAARPSSCGIPWPISEVRVVDEDGHDVAPGDVGEFWIRGPQVMKEYWNAPEATKAAFDGDWFKTGDLGCVDEEGFIHVVDRKTDMVISAGENIYCAEVERVLSSEPALAEFAVFGVPDERLGERAIAAVTLRDGSDLDEAQIKAFVRASLADYKVPAAVVFDLGPLPRTATGKVDKVRLRAAYQERAKGSDRPPLTRPL
jgi:acyl-CoA synthetase (AMP-forming)/AMP-acid ligase II